MESFKEIPRKRKQSTSDPFDGTFTRSKSLIYTHQNRSGRARSDAIRKRPHHQVDLHCLTLSRKKRVRSSNNDDHHSHEMSLLSIKDLRARRVFSQPLDTDLEESKVLDGTNGDLCKEKSEPELDTKCSGESGKREEVDSNLEGLSDGNPNLSIPESEVSEAEDQRSGPEEDGKCNDGDEKSEPELDTKCSGESGKREEVDSNLEGFSDGNPNLSIPESEVSEAEDQRSGPEEDGKCNDGDDKSEPELDTKCSGESGKREEVDSNLEGLSDGNPNLLIPESEVSEAEDQRSGPEEDGKCNDGDRRVFQNLKDMSLVPKENVVGPADFRGQKCEEPSDEIVQATPPDSVISIEQKVNADGAINNGNSLQKSSSTESPPSHNYEAGSAQNISANAIVRNDSNSKRRPVLSRCSGLKVYKTPSSFSYKRLLPYLMEIAKDKSRTVDLESSHKIEIAANGKVSEKPQDSVLKETSTGRPNLDEKMEIASSELLSDKPQGSLPKGTLIFREKSEIDANENIPEKSKHSPLKETSFGSPNFDVKTVEPVLPSIPEETPKSEHEEDRHVTDSSTQMALVPIPTRCSSDYSPDKLPCSPQTSQLVLAIEQDVSPIEPVSSDSLKGLSNEKNGRLTFYSCRDATSSPTVGLAKGILKRNPRGCRGLCDCLDCVSFRLHAERAFEFSTNQMKDAEEVTLDLIKELSQMRCLLEKSALANGSSVASVDEVKEACAKASSAEECARTHLRQMNEDLYVHCRTKSLQRPRVNFASCVEGKVVEKCPSARKGRSK